MGEKHVAIVTEVFLIFSVPIESCFEKAEDRCRQPARASVCIVTSVYLKPPKGRSLCFSAKLKFDLRYDSGMTV